MKTISFQELQEVLNRKESMALINVLPEDAFRQAHIPGSVNVPLADEKFVEKVKKKTKGKDQKVVVYCSSFDCMASTQAAERLEQAGFRNVLDYKGGLKDWFKLSGEFPPRRAWPVEERT